jgi:single-strand DNA-binding protein
MPNANLVVLMGHLTADPELRYTPQGAAVCDFTIASNRRYTKEDGEKQEEVVFVDVTAWRRQAETCAEYLKKGSCAHVEGRLVQESWEDKETGKKRSKLKIVANSVQFVGGGSKDDEPAPEAEPPKQEAPAKGTVAKPPAKSKR